MEDELDAALRRLRLAISNRHRSSSNSQTRASPFAPVASSSVPPMTLSREPRSSSLAPQFNVEPVVQVDTMRVEQLVRHAEQESATPQLGWLARKFSAIWPFRRALS